MCLHIKMFAGISATNLLRVVEILHELLNGAMVSEGLKCLGLVLRKSVVHIKSYCGDVPHVERPIAEHLLPNRNASRLH